MTTAKVFCKSDRDTLLFISSSPPPSAPPPPRPVRGALVLVKNHVAFGFAVAFCANCALFPHILSLGSCPDSLFSASFCASFRLHQSLFRLDVLSGGESALHANGGSLTDGPPGGNDAVAEDADPEAKRRRTEVGSPSPSAPQSSRVASTSAPIVGTQPTGTLQAQGTVDALLAIPDGQPDASTDFAAAAALAIAAAAATSSGAASTASQPPNKASSGSASVLSSGTAPAAAPIDVKDNDEDEDGEYDPTAWPCLPGVQIQSFGADAFERRPQTRPTTDQSSGESLKLEKGAPLSTAEVLKMKQPNGHPSVEVGGPPAVNEQAAPLAVENEASAASTVLPESSTTTNTTPVVAAPPPVATAGAAVSDAVALGAVGTERSAAPLPGNSAPATTLSPKEPHPVSGAPPAPVNVEEPLSSSPGVVTASAEANARPFASTPPSPSVTETDMGANSDASQAVQPPSPPIGSSTGQKPLPESVEVESEDVRCLRLSTHIIAFVMCR